MRKTLISLVVVFVLFSFSCSNKGVDDIIAIGSIREVVILESYKSYAVDETGIRVSISMPFSKASEAEWSPDNQWIVYQTEETAKHDDPKIFIVKADGSKKFELTDNIYKCGFTPSWSPDGQKIAAYFSCTTNDLSGIYIVDVTCLLVKEGCVLDYQFLIKGQDPTWSPDGSQIAYSIPNHEIYVVSVNNPTSSKLISMEGADCLRPAWSPIGDLLAMNCSIPNEGSYISLVDSNGNNFRNIIDYGSSPIWSPDGSKIAFISSPFGSKEIGYHVPSDAVYIMDNDGSNIVRVTPYENEIIQWVDWIDP